MNKTFASIVAAVAVLPLFAGIELGAPFTDGAVLQRGMKVPVWGNGASPDGKVVVSFAGQEKSAVASNDGKWKVELDSMEASRESRAITVKDIASGEAVEVKDVLVGEVWFASGQSNMECPIWGNNPRYRDMKGGLMTTMTRLPNIRYVKCPRDWVVTPGERVHKAKWCKFVPEDLQLFHRIDTQLGGSNTGVSLSAVAFYYARELYLALDVPIGILDASWGGTNIDAWTPRRGYDGCDESIREMADYPVKADWKKETDAKGPVSANHKQPTVLYNGMVSFFAPMAMRGVIWYQGCSNGKEPELYCAKLHALYNGWSRDFANPDLKFYLAQLAPYNQNWLGICMAQTKFCAEQKNAALAVTADVGNFYDIHPNDKEIVAKRLVVHALKRDYGFAIREDDSPVLNSVSFADGKATLKFDHVRDWYVYAPDYSHDPAFELAGEDGNWRPAKIANFRMNGGKESYVIPGDTIVLSSDKVPAPKMVRYMGQPRTSGTLYNEASLPLGPFESK